MGTLIDDILQFSRVGRSELQRTDVDMTALALDVTNEFRADYPQAEVSVSELPRAGGDAPMLRQVWANLIGNALKFSAKIDKPRIMVGTIDAPGQPVFFVRDNGVGFDMAYAEKLFQVFQRLHTEKEFPGTGAGLAIVKRIVERHDGRIWAEAQPNLGATVYFTLGG
jgi:light-regulated signal transduction histidine kinase (bacteriophytochrome)